MSGRIENRAWSTEHQHHIKARVALWVRLGQRAEVIGKCVEGRRLTPMSKSRGKETTDAVLDDARILLAISFIFTDHSAKSVLPPI